MRLLNIANNRRRIVSKAVPSVPSFTFDVQVTSTFQLPLVSSGAIDLNVDWGDASSDNITVYNQAETLHTYLGAGLYTIKITGDVKGFKFNNSGDKNLVREVKDVSSLVIDQASTFHGCGFMTWNASVPPTISGINLSSTFQGCTSFNGDLTGWDVSSATNLQSCFNGCAQFNNNGLKDWDVSNCTNFMFMLFNATIFNGRLDWTFKTAGNPNILAMNFLKASAFNNDSCLNWDVSRIGTFTGMFQDITEFNQDISGWDVSFGQSFSNIFNNATSFNFDISSWDITNVGGSPANDLSYFMWNKSAASYNAEYLSNIYIKWSELPNLDSNMTTQFGAIKYDATGQSARDLLTNTAASVSVSTCADNGGGLIRVTTSAVHGLTTGDKVCVNSVVGTTEANGGAIVTVISTTEFDIDGSTFTNAYVSDGTVISGYGWTITDGGQV